MPELLISSSIVQLSIVAVTLVACIVVMSQGRPFSTDMTDGCGKSKGCYRNPPQCAEEACDMVVTWVKHSDRVFEFEMSADTDGWVALGLSDDKFMVRPFPSYRPKPLYTTRAR